MTDTPAGYTSKKHRWGEAAPGQGRGEVCVVCGIKRVHGDGGECTTFHSEHIVPTSSEYDPIQ